MLNITHRLRLALDLFKWFWLHKTKSFCGSLGLLIGTYTVVCVLVSCSSSPTDQRVGLTEDREVAFKEYPQAQTQRPHIILLHGAPADASSWNKLLTRRAEIDAGEIVVVDRIGYGNSSDEDELTLAGHAKSIEPLLNEVAEGKTIIVGHSYGGPVALRLAVEYPEQIGGLVLVAGATDAYMQDSQWFRRGVDRIRLLVPKDWERANRELLALTNENRAMEPMLGQVVCPVVIVHGTWDSVCPHDSTLAYLQDRLIKAKAVRVVSIPRARHNLHLTHIDEVIEAINSIE